MLSCQTSDQRPQEFFFTDCTPALRRAVRRCGNFFQYSALYGKLIAGTLTKSIGITADAFNNLSDAGSSTITLVGFRLSEQKPTRSILRAWQFEYIAGLVVSMAILLMGFELAKTSIDKILHPEP